VDDPENINVVSIKEREETHGSPKGEAGLVIVWGGNGYDSNTTWLSCPLDSICDLSSWE
jgi:hypothetical protein